MLERKHSLKHNDYYTPDRKLALNQLKELHHILGGTLENLEVISHIKSPSEILEDALYDLVEVTTDIAKEYAELLDKISLGVKEKY